MAILKFDSILFTPGRACAGPLAIVLHEWSSGIETLDAAMNFCPRPRPAQSPGCHTSFHYGVSGSIIHQYVLNTDTAWGFGVTPPTCPAPVCPPDPCESCTGLTVDQYNPDIDGNPPVLPPFVAGPDGTANCAVLHVAVPSGVSTSNQPGCCGFFQQNPALDKQYANFVNSLAQIFLAAGLVPSQSTLLVHCGELLCLDIDQLVADIIAEIAVIITPPVLPPCPCDPGINVVAVDSASVDLTVTEAPAGTFTITATVTSVPPAAFCATLGALPVSVVPAVTALGPDCQFHPLPPAADVNVVGLDTATIDITVVEAPANTFTISADLLTVPQAAFCAAVAALPAGPLLAPGHLVITQDGCDVEAFPTFCQFLATRPATVPTPAVPGVTQLLGADCLTYTVPAGGDTFTLLDCAGAAVPSGSEVITPANLFGAALNGGANSPQILAKGAAAGDCPVEVQAPTNCPTVDGARAGSAGDNAGWRFLAGNKTTGALEWHFLGDDLIDLGGGTIDVNAPQTYPKFITVNVPQLLTAPADGCARTEIYIKNVGSSPITITGTPGTVTIDGQNVITLDGTIPAGYPFGNDGGEAVHLVWSVPANEWKVF